MVKRWVWKITRFGYCAGPPKVGTPGPGLGNRQIAAVGRNLCTTGGKTGCGEKNRGAAVGNSWKIGGDNRGIGWEIRPAPPGPSPSGCPHPFPPVFHGLIHRFARGSRPLRRLGAARGRSPAPPESLTCYKKGVIFASGIVYPAVRTKEARIRISVLAFHEITQMGNCRRQRH